MVYLNFYAFTGGPGSGKTTVLKKLSSLGYDVVQETAREIIKERIRQGLSPRPELKEFAKLMLQKDLNNFKFYSKSTLPVLFDRSIVDSSCLVHEYAKSEYNLVKTELLAFRLNPEVFIFPPWVEIYKNDEERDQTFAEAIEVFDKLANWYAKEGYALIEVPKLPIEERVEFIIRHIKKNNINT